MGLFSEKTIIVSSVVYNLAGDVDKRPNYLKGLVLKNVIADNRFSMTDTINSGYLHGPGMRFRNFASWAEGQGYNTAMGTVTAAIDFGNSINYTVLGGQIPHAVDETAVVQAARVGYGDFVEWAEEYVRTYYPALYDTDWAADYSAGTNQITIHWFGGGTTSFTPVDFDPHARYLYADYMLTTDVDYDPLVTGSTITLDPAESFPSTSGWTELSYTETLQSVTLTTFTDVLVEYSDARPDETSHTETNASSSYLETHGSWTKTVPLGITGNRNYAQIRTMYQDQTGVVVALAPVETVVTEDIGGGVTKTTTTTVVEQVVSLVRKHRTDTQDYSYQAFSELKSFRYRYATGNATLDAMFAVPDSSTRFFPYIPIRIDNAFISSTMPDKYALAKKAWKKLTGDKLDKTQAMIADNPDLGDIDYAYAVFGVSLNVKENACKKYQYKFFQSFFNSAEYDPTVYQTWKDGMIAAQASLYNWWVWRQGEGPEGSPTGEPEPAILPYPELPVSSVHTLSSGAPVMNFDMNIQWVDCQETVGVGVLGARDTLWWEYLGHEEFLYGYIVDGVLMYDAYPRKIEQVRLTWQDGANSWRSMTIRGLTHTNRIYGGQSVVISAGEAIADLDESGFIIPLHEGVYQAMSLVDSTQMSTACCNLVFNCYQVVKKKWYQTGLFKVILVVIIIVIAVYTGGLSASGTGLLGSNIAVGTALGFTGLAAVIVGAAANAIAATLLVTLIQKGATTLFGEKLGIIIGFVAGLFALQAGTAYMNGVSFTASLSSLVRAENLLKLTAGGINAYSQYMQVGVQETLQETAQITENYTATMDQIEALTKQNLGNGLANFNPLELTDAGQSYIAEPPDAFLSRTLMTGSEIATMSIDMLTNFVDATLNLNPAI